MKNLMRMIPPLAALALGACSGGGGNGSSTEQPPPMGNSNTAPGISGLAAKSSVLQDGSSEPIAFEVSDAEADASALRVTVSSSNPELLRVAGISIGGNDRERTLLLTPQPGRSGTATITVSATDPEGLSANRALSLTVTTREESFRNFAVATIGAAPDSQPAEVAGHAWMDTATNDPSAFDGVLSAIAE